MIEDINDDVYVQWLKVCENCSANSWSSSWAFCSVQEETNKYLVRNDFTKCSHTSGSYRTLTLMFSCMSCWLFVCLVCVCVTRNLIVNLVSDLSNCSNELCFEYIWRISAIMLIADWQWVTMGHFIEHVTCGLWRIKPEGAELWIELLLDKVCTINRRIGEDLGVTVVLVRLSWWSWHGISEDKPWGHGTASGCFRFVVWMNRRCHVWAIHLKTCVGQHLKYYL